MLELQISSTRPTKPDGEGSESTEVRAAQILFSFTNSAMSTRLTLQRPPPLPSIIYLYMLLHLSSKTARLECPPSQPRDLVNRAGVIVAEFLHRLRDEAVVVALIYQYVTKDGLELAATAQDEDPLKHLLSDLAAAVVGALVILGGAAGVGLVVQRVHGCAAVTD